MLDANNLDIWFNFNNETIIFEEVSTGDVISQYNLNSAPPEIMKLVLTELLVNS